MRRWALRWIVLGFLAAVPVRTPPAHAELGDLSADGVLGRATLADSTALAIDAASIGKPTGIAVDRVRHRLYVSDGLNHRVLGWSDIDTVASGAPADLVVGQPDFVSWGCNRSFDGSKTPVTMDSLCDPAGLAVDSAGSVFVADAGNCRVLVFDDPFATDGVADRVLGGTCGGPVGPQVTRPTAVAVDADDNVFVADFCRVLEFDGPLGSTDDTADRVYGQSDFTSNSCSALYFPQGLTTDASGRLWVGSQSLVYEFDSPLTGGATRPVATRTIGTQTCNPNGVTSSSTCFPAGVATDSAGRLYVADTLNSRVLGFDAPLTIGQAAVVFGQPSFGPPAGGLTFCGHEACNNAGASASTLCLGEYRGSVVSCAIYWAAAVAVDASDNLWVADGFNNRVLRYDRPRTSDRVADLVLGQQSMTGIASPTVPLDGPRVALSQSDYRVIGIDTTNSRLLVYNNLGKSFSDEPVAIIGQPDVASTACNGGGISAHSLCHPTAALVDRAGALWIADTDNDRVLRFDAPWFAWDYPNQKWVLKRDADAVLGQPDFQSAGCNAGNQGLCRPRGLAVDAVGNLYVSDGGNNRIVVDQNPLTNDRTFEVVYGQPSFTTTGCQPGAGGAGALCDPQGIAIFSHVDAYGVDQGDDLYVADRGNNRVVLYRSVNAKPSASSADGAFGQAGSLSTGICSGGADGLCGPTAVAVDRGGSLLVADTDNNRVLVYESPLDDTTADRVFGQSGFDAVACNQGATAPSAESLCAPRGVATSGAYEGNVFVADTGNDRILRYEAPYCIESFSLTAANRRDRTIRSKPSRTRIKITSGPSASAADDTLELRDKLVLLERDGGIYPGYPPLFTLATDASFTSGVVFKESVLPWISNVRSGANSELWSTGDLELDHGITRYDVNERFYIPPGFGDSPQRDYVSYKALAVGENVSGLTGSSAWLRAQLGSTCFTTELKCAVGTQRRVCKAAPASR